MKSKMPLDPKMRELQPQRLLCKTPYEGRVLRVCDGDTIVVGAEDPPRGFHEVEFVRLAGIDAPELRGFDARAALWSQQYLESLIGGQVVTVHPRRIWRDPYGRIVATVTFSGHDVCACLIRDGHAVERKTRS